MSGRTTVNIDTYAADDNANLSDDLLIIASGATEVLLGDSGLNDDAIDGLGRVSVCGPTVIDDELAIGDDQQIPTAIQFVNSSSIAQFGPLVLNADSAGNSVVRNISGATWTLENGSSIFQELVGAQFVNLGTLVNLGTSTITADFYARGGTILSPGTLSIGNLFAPEVDYVYRMVDDMIEGAGTVKFEGGVELLFDGTQQISLDDVLVGSSVSVATANLDKVRTVGAVDVSSSTVKSNDIVNVAPGSVLDFTNQDAQISLTGVDNNGTFEATGGAPLVINNTLSGVGVLEIGQGGVTLGANVSPLQTLDFQASVSPLSSGSAGPALILDDPNEFHGAITGFDRSIGADDKITLNSTSSASAWQFQGYSSSSSALDFTNAGGATATIHIAGTFTADDFHAIVSGSSTTITYG